MISYCAGAASFSTPSKGRPCAANVSFSVLSNASCSSSALNPYKLPPVSFSAGSASRSDAPSAGFLNKLNSSSIATRGCSCRSVSLRTTRASTCLGSESSGPPSSLNMVRTTCAFSMPSGPRTGTKEAGTALHQPSMSPLSRAIRGTSRPQISCAMADLGSLMPSLKRLGNFSIGSHFPLAAPLQSVINASTVSIAGC